MKSFVGSNWKNNLTGQLDYLLSELRTSYTRSWSAINSAPNSLGGARTVADVFVRDFERPAKVDAESVKRQNNASAYWKRLVT